MSEQEYESEPEENSGEPPNKRRKTGTDTYVDVPVEAQAEDEDDDDDDEEEEEEEEDSDIAQNTNSKQGIEAEDDLDGFIANEDEIEAERDAERRRKHRKRSRKKKRRHNVPKISEDTLRMLAEQRGEKYKPDIDIDAGLSDDSDNANIAASDDSDDEDGGTQRRILKKRVMDFDEESVMGNNDRTNESDDDFHDYGDDGSVIGGYDNNHNHNNRNDTGYDINRNGTDSNNRYDDDFVVQDMPNHGRYASYYENDQIAKLYEIFGKNIYDFLGIPSVAQDDDIEDEEKNEELIEREKRRQIEEAKESESKFLDIKRGLEGLDAKQKEEVINIINTDIPERLQDRINKTDDDQITEIALNKEAQWILCQTYFVKLGGNGRKFEIETIITFLKYIRINYYDVPYIITYLQDEYPLDVEAKDIWKIDELDEKYQQIYLRKKNIEMYLNQIKKKLIENIKKKKENLENNNNNNNNDDNDDNDDNDGVLEDDENQRWLERVDDVNLFLFDASSHEELEAVDLFLNIIPTSDGNNNEALNIYNNNNGGNKKELEYKYPSPPTDLILGDAIDLISRFSPSNSDRSQISDILDEIGDKLRSNPIEQELQQSLLEIGELNKLKEFYIGCMNDIDNAASFEIDSELFDGEEAFNFLGGSQTDLEELDDNIRRITTRIHELETDRNRSLEEWKLQKQDYEIIENYYRRCYSIMPQIKKTKKAASILRSGGSLKNNGSYFKLSIPSVLLPLCRNIGFSNILSDNIKQFGSLHGELNNDSISNLCVEQTELAELTESISSSNIDKYATSDDVITDCIYHLARHIGHEPILKCWISKQLIEYGVISSQPTLKGRDLIDWTDELAAVKRLENKPISKFLNKSDLNNISCDDDDDDDDLNKAKLHWLLINKGTKQGLLRNHISIPHGDIGDIDYMATYRESNNVESTILFFLYKLGPMFIAQSSKIEWKLIKCRILHDALNLYLIPFAVRWIKSLMLDSDESIVINDACLELSYIASMGGVRSTIGGNLLSIIVGEENNPSFLVLLNKFGDVIDETMLHYMKISVRLDPNNEHKQTILSSHDRLQLEKKNGDLKLFKQFVEQHKPSMIIIDAGNLSARNFKIDIEKVLASNDYISNSSNSSNSSAVDISNVFFVDPCVSLLYRNSDDAIKEFQSWSVNQRQAVSLGRFVLDPITELTKRWCIDSKTGKNEMLSLPLHKNINDLSHCSRNKLLSSYRKILMNIVNQVGVMINLCAQRDFLNGPIQFISGLGPRKAKNLIFELKKRGRFISRSQLFRSAILSTNVYLNSIGFIRINHLKMDCIKKRMNDESEQDSDDSDDGDSGDMNKSDINLLDDTRIHPDDYHWATVVVISAMDIDEESAYSNDTLLTLRKAENLNKLEILNLDIFAERIRRRRNTRIVHKLYLIKQEVRSGFGETRIAFKSPREDELYHLLCGQTRASLREGMLVNVIIKSITASGIKCRLPSCGLDAWLPAENISRSIRDEFLNLKQVPSYQSDECRTARKDLILSFLKQKTHLQCRVISIDKSKFSVKLSCLQSDIKNIDNQHEIPLNCDDYLNRSHPNDDSKKAVDAERRELIRNRPLHRNIKYPAFFNISRDEAIGKLSSSKGCGQLIFRPSSRGLNYLSMTWKMAEDPPIFVNYLIEEKEKPNPYAVGKQLIVGKEIYDDLDEIFTHHRPRLNELTFQMIQHRNFRYGTENDIEECLFEEMNVNQKTCYALSYSYQRPGHFLLSYIISSRKQKEKRGSDRRMKVEKEYIGLTYLGYKFRNNYFDDAGKLINWFKQNFKKNHPKYVKREKLLKHAQQSINVIPPPSHPHDHHDHHNRYNQNNNNHHYNQQPPSHPYHHYNNNNNNNNNNNHQHQENMLNDDVIFNQNDNDNNNHGHHGHHRYKRSRSREAHNNYNHNRNHRY